MQLSHEMTYHPYYRLGIRPTDRARLASTVRLKLTGVPPHAATADYISDVTAWMLGGNDRFGTCGPTSVANLLVLTYKFLTGEDITVTDDAVFDLYRRSGNPGFDPATGAGDDGVDMTVMLSALVAGGIEITRADGSAETVRPYCYARYGTDVDDIRAVTDIFGGTLWGMNLSVAQQAQTDTHPPLWDYVAKSPAWGGHAVVGGEYTSQSGPGEADETIITWAQPVGTTDAFAAHELAECYVVVFPVLWEHPAFAANVDTAALAADYTMVTGQPFPVPVPVPPPGPVPVPPVPVPVPPNVAGPADVALAGAVSAWAAGHHVGANEAAARAFQAWAKAKGL